MGRLPSRLLALPPAHALSATHASPACGRREAHPFQGANRSNDYALKPHASSRFRPNAGPRRVPTPTVQRSEELAPRSQQFGSLRWNATSGRVCGCGRAPTALGDRRPPFDARVFILALAVNGIVGSAVNHVQCLSDSRFWRDALIRGRSLFQGLTSTGSGNGSTGPKQSSGCSLRLSPVLLRSLPRPIHQKIPSADPPSFQVISAASLIL
jgi:hypothetical protein